MTKFSFWFSEFKKVVQLLDRQKPGSNQADESSRNIFSATTPKRASEIFNAVSTRIKSLDPSFYSVFKQVLHCQPEDFIVLIAIMETDSLFFDFVYEVYREKLIIGMAELADSDFAIFFKKQTTTKAKSCQMDGSYPKNAGEKL